MFRLREWLGVGLLFAVLTTIVFWPLPAQWLTHAPGHHDTLFNMWRLSWIAEAVTTHPSRLFDPPIFYPAARVLAFSDAVLLQGLLATPWLAMGAPLLPVSNVIFLLGPWMSAMGMYLLVRDLLDEPATGNRQPATGQLLPATGNRQRATGEAGDRVPDDGYRHGAGSVVEAVGPALRARPSIVCWPAVIAGTIFGLLPFRIDHVMHLELQWSQWMPLACWALYRTVRDGRVRDGVLAAVFVLAQFLSCIYYGVFLVLSLGLTAPLLLLGRRRAPLMAIGRALLVGGVVCAGPLLAYSAPYRANQQTFGGRGASEIDTWSATPGSFISAPPDNRLYGHTWRYAGSEGRFWPGIVAIGLAGVGLWTTRRLATTWMFAAALLVSSVLAMGTHTPAYRVVLALVPIMKGLRAPARFGMIAALALAVLAGFGAASVLARVPRRALRNALGAVMVAGLAVEYASSVGPLHPWVQRAPIYARWLRTQPPGVVVDLPIARAGSLPLHEAEWSFYGRTHGRPLVNGYSGYYPRAYLNLLEAMTSFPRGGSVAALRERDVRYIVMHEDRYEPADLMEFDSRMRGTPGLRFVGRFPDPDYPTTIFELEP
jgi:hypothetical protein